jgi:hypothetical protein
MVLTPSMITSICTLLHKLVYLKSISLSPSRVLSLLDDKNKLKKKMLKKHCAYDMLSATDTRHGKPLMKTKVSLREEATCPSVTG